MSQTEPTAVEPFPSVSRLNYVRGALARLFGRDCNAYEHHRCDGEVVAVVDGTPLCRHHVEKSDVYDYPRGGDA